MFWQPKAEVPMTDVAAMARPMILAVFLGLIGVLLLPGVNVAKRSGRDEIKQISDFKEFKKFLRTHNNVLVIFATSEKSVTDWKLLGDVAQELRGTASLVFIDCGEDKKLCKKLKVSPSAVEYKHYSEGEFNKDYDRKFSFKSLLNFFRDPKGDIPWEEEAEAENVVHLDNRQALTKLLSKDRRPTLIMFYAPWCGFCKRLKPEYSKAATDLKGEAILAGMDVDRPENIAIRTEYNITGFPTMLYFERGMLKYKYGGENSYEGLVKWMRNPQPVVEKEAEAEWADTESEVVHLQTSNFDEFLAENPSVLVMFYAPWCGHCKKMKPEFEEAAEQLKKDEVEGVLAGIDATKEKDLGERFKVKGYPTVKYFKNGEEAWDYNERTADKIIEFMKDPKEPPPPPPPEPAWEETESHVNHLATDTFKGFLKKKKHCLVMFYAPWCGHCKKAKPEFMQAAEQYSDDIKVAFAAVDCTAHQVICTENDVTGYPTFVYYNYGKNAQKYTGGREEADFVSFMADPQNPSATRPPPPPVQPMQWDDVPGNENLHHLSDSNFHSFTSAFEGVLVMFYAPWCGHCKKMKPAYAEAASLLKEAGVKGILATVDATAERKLASQYEVKGYPTLKYFKNGEYQYEYSKGRTAQEIVSFMKHPKGPQPPEPKWSEEQSDVVHLGSESFTEFTGSRRDILVMFYAPWCPHCKAVKPDMVEAADLLKEDEDKFLAAVDCTDAQDICKEQGIKGYPTFKYFHNGDAVTEYDGPRNKIAFVNFLKNPSPGLPEPLSPEPADSAVPSGEQDSAKEEL